MEDNKKAIDKINKTKKTIEFLKTHHQLGPPFDQLLEKIWKSFNSALDCIDICKDKNQLMGDLQLLVSQDVLPACLNICKHLAKETKQQNYLLVKKSFFAFQEFLENMLIFLRIFTSENEVSLGCKQDLEDLLYELKKQMPKPPPSCIAPTLTVLDQKPPSSARNLRATMVFGAGSNVTTAPLESLNATIAGGMFLSDPQFLNKYPAWFVLSSIAMIVETPLQSADRSIRECSLYSSPEFFRPATEHSQQTQSMPSYTHFAFSTPPLSSVRDNKLTESGGDNLLVSQTLPSTDSSKNWRQRMERYSGFPRTCFSPEEVQDPIDKFEIKSGRRK